VSDVILNVTFDCADAQSVASFWSKVTGWACSKEEMPGNPYWVVGMATGEPPRLVFVEVPEVKALKNRVHLDLVPVDASQAEEISRLQSLGARVVDDRRLADPGGWVVMADPEGNEFCVERGVNGSGSSPPSDIGS
jgi:predicted enzyme related to lactoylglutathione lyase